MRSEPTYFTSMKAMPVLIVILLAIISTASAQDSTLTSTETASVAPLPLTLTPKIATYDYDAMPKDPLASAMLSATLPGTGQIYNKEYLNGAITAVGFYTSLFITQYMLSVFENFNMDTTYFEETNQVGTSTGVIRMVRLPRPEANQTWPSNTEKAVFIGSLITTGVFYVFGIYDAYNGARRYNKKLYHVSLQPAVELTGIQGSSVGLNFLYTF